MCFFWVILKQNPIDLSSLFNWNTKLLFVYVVAEYSKPRYVRPTAGCLPHNLCSKFVKKNI